MKKTLIFLILVILFYNCSKDSGVIEQENYTKLTTNAIEIKPNTKVFDFSENSISFNSENEVIKKLKEGDVIVSGRTLKVPSGYARKITKIQNQGNIIVLETTQAKITEVFEEININSSLKIDYSKQPIVTSKSNFSSKLKFDEPFYDKLDFKFNTVTQKYEYEIEFKKDASSNSNGKISFKGSFQINDEGSEFVYNLRPFTEKVFSLKNRMKVIMDTSIEASGSLEAEKKTLELAKIPLTYTLPTSLVVNIYLGIRIGVSGKVSAKFFVENTKTITMDHLLSYTEKSGWITGGISKSDSETNFNGNLELEMNSYFEPGIVLEFEQFRGVEAGIYIENYLKFDAITNDNLDIDWNLGYGIKAKGEAKIELLGDDFLNQDYELVFWEKPYTKLTGGTYNVAHKIYSGDVILSTQQEVENFGKENYTIIEGDLTIGEFPTYLKKLNNDISDLSKLNSIVKVKGNVNLVGLISIDNLTGLDKLKYIGKSLNMIGGNQVPSISFCGGGGCHSNFGNISNIASLSGLNFIGEKVKISYYPIINFCSIKEVLLKVNDLEISNNTYNPTLQDLQNGKCSN